MRVFELGTRRWFEVDDKTRLAVYDNETRKLKLERISNQFLDVYTLAGLVVWVGGAIAMNASSLLGALLISLFVFPAFVCFYEALKANRLKAEALRKEIV